MTFPSHLGVDVVWSPYPPLPFATVRDLLGITRAMYRATKADDPGNLDRLRALESIGVTLQRVLHVRTAHPGTTDYFDAWAAAERATWELAHVAGESTPLRPLITAAAGRLTRPGSMG